VARGLTLILLVGAAVFFGGAGDDSIWWIGTLALLAAAGAYALGARTTRAGAIALGLLGGFVLWNGLSLLWSTQPDRSWSYFNRGLVYLAFALAGLLLAGRAREVVDALAVLLGLVAVWALAVKLFPGLSPSITRVDRLSAPAGDPNELGLLGDFALPLGLWVATRRSRVLGLLLAGLWAVVLVLTYSRGSLLVAAFVTLAWVAVALPRWRRAAGIAAAALVLLLAAGIAVRWDDIATPAAVYVENDPGRIASASGNNRWSWWTEAWRGFREQPVHGSGAGTFELTHLRLRPNDNATQEPHDVALQFLTETGAVGLLLLAGSVAAAAVAVVRRRPDAAAATLALLPAAYLVHALLEIDWDFLAVSAPAFFALGVLLGEEPRRRRPVHGLVAGAVALAAVSSLLFPWLAERRLAASYAATDPARAARLAHQARGLNPAAIEPIIAEANAKLLGGDEQGAYDLYAEATRVQPSNPEAWFELGRFEANVLGSPRAAFPHLERFTELDPQGAGGELYRAVRKQVNGVN
jgi:tetratricopeptide (TPR) repeat protein